MKSIASNVRQVNSRPSIPDGEYEGTWSGYTVYFVVNDKHYIADSKAGIRSMHTKCTVVIKDGNIDIEA